MDIGLWNHFWSSIKFYWFFVEGWIIFQIILHINHISAIQGNSDHRTKIKNINAAYCKVIVTLASLKAFPSPLSLPSRILRRAPSKMLSLVHSWFGLRILLSCCCPGCDSSSCLSRLFLQPLNYVHVMVCGDPCSGVECDPEHACACM